MANAKSGWLLTHRAAPGARPQHKAFTYLPLLEAAGCAASAGPYAYEYVMTEVERQAAYEWLAARQVPPGSPFVILHPGANWTHKRWAAERFAALGDRLAQARGAAIVITGAPEDRGLAASIQQQMRHPAVALAGSTTLRQLAACLSCARLVVSNDTGVLHLAAALATPIVALYGPTSPALTGPLGDPTRMEVVHHADCCPRIPCYHPDRAAHPGMRSITVDEVFGAACRLLDLEPQAAPAALLLERDDVA
jgi:lipopolysaccharide heptosyltransferase II